MHYDMIRLTVRPSAIPILSALRPDFDLVINGDAWTLDIYDRSGVLVDRYHLK